MLSAILMRVFLGLSLLGAQPVCLMLMGGMKKAVVAPAKMHTDHSCCEKKAEPAKTPVGGDDPCQQRCDEARKAPTVAPNPGGTSLSVLHWAMVPAAMIGPAVLGADRPARMEWPLPLDRVGFISLTDLFHQSCLLTL